MIRKTFLISLALALFSYVAGLLNLPFLFIILFAGFSYVMLFTFGLVIWRVLTRRMQKNISEHKLLFLLALVGWLILFLLGWGVINKYYMPRTLDAVRISAKVLLLIISLLLGWLTINRVRKRTVGVCAFLYILLIVLAPVIMPNNNITDDSSKSTASKPSHSLSQKNLRTLPYLDWTPTEEPEKVSVTKYNPDSSYNGINIYTSAPKKQTYLMDMQGNIIHTWNLATNNNYKWHFSKFYPNGNLLAIAKGMIATFDWVSNRSELTRINVHHDFCVGSNGDIYIVVRRDSMIFIHGWPVPIVEDYIAIVDPNGKLKKKYLVLQFG